MKEREREKDSKLNNHFEKQTWDYHNRIFHSTRKEKNDTDDSECSILFYKISIEIIDVSESR